MGQDVNLLDPQTNISVSAHYISQLMAQWKGQVPLVLASYNAGEDPVGEWMRRFATPDPILFIDLMPYRETRDYVGYVLANYFWYHKVHDKNGTDPVRPFITDAVVKK